MPRFLVLIVTSKLETTRLRVGSTFSLTESLLTCPFNMIKINTGSEESPKRKLKFLEDISNHI